MKSWLDRELLDISIRQWIEIWALPIIGLIAGFAIGYLR
jgi:hypothetical protein